MTKRIFRSIFLVALVVLLLSVALLSVVFYNDYAVQYRSELKSEALSMAHAINGGLAEEDYLRSLEQDFLSAMRLEEPDAAPSPFTIATGTAAAPFLTGLVQQAQARFPDLRGEVVAIDNDFFGHTIDVAGLLTGQDLSAQLQRVPSLGRVLLPLHMLRHGETVFLDDYTVERLSQELGRPVQVVGLDGFDLADALFAPAESRQDNGRS